jgi:hypothetical protein
LTCDRLAGLGLDELEKCDGLAAEWNSHAALGARAPEIRTRVANPEVAHNLRKFAEQASGRLRYQ